MGGTPPDPGHPSPPPPGTGLPPPGGGPDPGQPPLDALADYGYAPRERAGFGARLGAFLVDAVIAALLLVPAMAVLYSGPTRTTTCRVENGNVTFGDEPNALCKVPTTGAWVASILLLIAAVLAAAAYFGLLEGGRTGQTVGKRALGIRVVDIDTEGELGVRRGVGRYFARWLSALVCGVGYLWMLWDPQKQCWHDKIVRSAVVRA